MKFLITKKLQNRQQEYKYYPTTRDELQDIIVDLLKRGETDLNCIDVSNITDMQFLFYNINREVIVEDIDISEWNVSNVRYMNGMFDRCKNFNSDLSKWNVSHVQYMYHMFYWCHEFNSDLSNWDVSNVTDMEYMFNGCKKFNSELSNWVVSKVKDTRYMFDNCDTLIKTNKIPDWYSN